MKQNSATSSRRPQERVAAAEPAATPQAPQPRNIQRADVAPTRGFAIMVDGCMKTNYDDEAAAKKAATDLLSRFPKLHVEIFDATTKTRSKV
jgi:hypothetical protein